MGERMGRRGFLKAAGASLALPAFVSSPMSSHKTWASDPRSSGKQAQGETISNRVIFLCDETFYFEFLRTMGHAYAGGADVNECILTGYRIIEGDDESWYEEWSKTAERVLAAAEHSEAEGHTSSAGEAYLRASNYFRTAEFFLHADPEDTRALSAWTKSRESFQNAIPYLPYDIELVEIPYEGTTLPGYFIRGVDTNDEAPLVIVVTGFDGTAEEQALSQGIPAAKRGYHCLVFEGPGQGRVIREQRLPFRHDWERVVTPVVDFAETLSGVDTSRIALYGLSFGGYLAPRACAFEPRIHTCIANGGYLSFYESVFIQIPPPLRQLIYTNPKLFEMGVELMKETDTKARWFMNDGMWKFAADSAADLAIKLEKYVLEHVVHRINCNVLVCDGEEEHFSEGQSRQFYDALTSPKEFMLFTIDEGAPSHCQSGAEAVSSQRIYDWLDDVMRGS